jgi:uncharacterized lipoprotein YbaY
MKLFPVGCLVAALVLVWSGCRGLDVTPETDPQRVVAGRVTLNSEVLFPPDAVAVVRVIEMTPFDQEVNAARKDLPVTDLRRSEVKVERVLGEQVIRAPGAAPIPFRVEFRADDSEMRRGLNIDVRISQGGRVTHRTMSAHMITLASVTYPQDVDVEAVR